MTNTPKTPADGVISQIGEQKPDMKKAETNKPSIKLMECQPSVIIKVGPYDQAVTWQLPKGLLTHVSPFFKAAFTRPWLESRTESISLPQDDPDAFRFYLHWLFTWTLCKSGTRPNVISCDVTSCVYLRAWILGDKLGCPLFQDFALLHLRYAGPPDLPLMREIFSKTPVGSKIRDWATHKIAVWIKKSQFKPHNQNDWIEAIIEFQDLAADIIRLQVQGKEMEPMNFFLLESSCE
ncbi:MAG: hypothetical protein Q9168_005839, partial [Polycauliona sp. 1 TL-2023]